MIEANLKAFTKQYPEMKAVNVNTTPDYKYTDVVASIIALIATPEPYWIFVDSGIPQIQESQILKKSKERFTAWSLGRSSEWEV